MTPEEFEKERLESAAALRRALESGRGENVARTAESVLGPEIPVHAVAPGSTADRPEPSKWTPPAPPDLRPVNESCSAASARSTRGIASLFDGSEEKSRAAQAKFNADQVVLDNALVTWTAEHFAATHRHYNHVITLMQKRMDDIDTRHRELERELVRHVHEMARRIDVVLGEGEKGRVSHEAALRSLRERLRSLEEKLG
jgi:hypothetical protein